MYYNSMPDCRCSHLQYRFCAEKMLNKRFPTADERLARVPRQKGSPNPARTCVSIERLQAIWTKSTYTPRIFVSCSYC